MTFNRCEKCGMPARFDVGQDFGSFCPRSGNEGLDASGR